ncbi:substrate-binding domain-containing protein [Konateibacter massiliensis]|uniref:substrate-binding domain-containing protein n=1 Tax=Konateibacter massiliensis TaxID=2002841 RepID=UPI000C15081E|nr:substrate-binding domain-containing protein [Konateibacter massiliensis]
MKERSLVIVLSDIHIGINSPTVWYRKEIHENYLLMVLKSIVDLADDVKEVILLGDIFEFWMYPPSQIPPSLDEIIAENPNVLGEEGALRQVLEAVQGRMVYIPGDHDINIVKSDLYKLKSKSGYVIKFQYGTYSPTYDRSIQFMHGHECTVINAPYFISRIAPLPLGYFVSRAIAYRIERLLEREPEKSIADFREYSAFSYEDFLPKLSFFYENFKLGVDVVNVLIDTLIEVTGMSEDYLIRISQFESATLREVRLMYQNKGIAGHQILQKDIVLQHTVMYKRSSALRDCGEHLVHITVMGHSHFPVIYRSEHHYINIGCMCPPVSRWEKFPLTFGMYHTDTKEFQILSVEKENGEAFFSVFASSNIKCQNNCVQIKAEEEPPPKSNFTFGWSVYNASLEYWQEMEAGVFAEAETLGIAIWENDEESSSGRMVLGSLELIERGVDALLIAPFNPELLPIIVENAKRRNIPVIAMDTGTGGADVSAFIVSDNFGGGILAGEYMLDLLERYRITNKNMVIIKVQETAKYALLRGVGFQSVMREKGYKLVAEPTANSIEEEGYIAMKRILETYGDDLAAVFSENGTMALGAARAIIEAGKRGKIMLVGFDADPSVLEAIKRGDMQGTIAQQPYRMGQIAVETANAILLGNPVTFDDWKEKVILMEVFLVNERGEFSTGII